MSVSAVAWKRILFRSSVAFTSLYGAAGAYYSYATYQDLISQQKQIEADLQHRSNAQTCPKHSNDHFQHSYSNSSSQLQTSQQHPNQDQPRDLVLHSLKDDQKSIDYESHSFRIESAPRQTHASNSLPPQANPSIEPSSSSPPPALSPASVSSDVAPFPRPRYPIVLVHGFFGYDHLISSPFSGRPILEYFGMVRSHLQKEKIPVIVPQLPLASSVRQRAISLGKALHIHMVDGDTETTEKEKKEFAEKVVVTQIRTKEKGNATDVEVRSKFKSSTSSVVDENGDVQNSLKITDNSAGDMEVSPLDLVVIGGSGVDLSKYKGKFNLITHSMGGLDARYLASMLGGEERIASITTISTPHRGTPLANMGLALIRAELGLSLFRNASSSHSRSASASASASSESLPAPESGSALSVTDSAGLLERSLLALGFDISGLSCLTTTYADRFNSRVVNRPSVLYWSYSAAKEVSVFSPLYLSYLVIHSLEGANDGMVSVKSAEWGQHIRTIPLDHMEQIGMGIVEAKEYLPMYREICQRLVDHGL